ncbi:shikimate kinase [Stieleria sp. TO1_6]|uniref:shikimate kinase n=1 Tax=Stieleria tagensis TaxID=2956795 RepID=UPI00209B0022|nr:shikimate kinase [Stieleria tagensis]MCO8122374.1 shikimate kinase [Stieleria tagensis]
MTKRIYLTGYRGTGKTTVGQLISNRLSMGPEDFDCVDLDQVIEQAAGKSIAELFAEGGEELFRDWESRCLNELDAMPTPPRVVSLGGGAILRTQNRQFIRDSGVCIWLTATPANIASRITADATSGTRRPSLTGLSPTEEIASVLASRESLYRDAADYVVATDGRTPAEVAAEILAWLDRS